MDLTPESSHLCVRQQVVHCRLALTHTACLGNTIHLCLAHGAMSCLLYSNADNCSGYACGWAYSAMQTYPSPALHAGVPDYKPATTHQTFAAHDPNSGTTDLAILPDSRCGESVHPCPAFGMVRTRMRDLDLQTHQPQLKARISARFTPMARHYPWSCATAETI
jgi:hypothetical protein